MRAFAYPTDLVDHLGRTWPADLPPDPLARHWNEVIAVAYQTSMTREEERPVRLRILLASEGDLREASSNDTLHVMRFDRSRPFSVEELRRLAPCTPFEASLVVVSPDEQGALRVWAIAWSGTSWLAPMLGGRRRRTFTTERTLIQVAGPGRVAVHAGDRFLAAIEQGKLMTAATNVFASRWMPAIFASARDEMVAEYDQRRHGEGVPIDETLIRSVSQQLLKRAIWLIRSAHHGGMLLFVEAAQADELLAGPLRAKYCFSPGESRARYRTLVRRIIDEMVRTRATTVTGRDFLSSTQELGDVEAAIFELSRLMAALAAVDGAVLLTKSFEILAAGVEVLGERGDPLRIQRALDLEGTYLLDDHEENVGTRHRAAYRFVQAHPRGLATVISQDGSIRFVTSLDGVITYFEQQMVG